MEETTTSQKSEPPQQAAMPDTPTPALPAEAGKKKDTYDGLTTSLIYAFTLFPITFLTRQFVLIFLAALPMGSFALSIKLRGYTPKHAFKCCIIITIACISVWISIGIAGNRIFYDWDFAEYDEDVAESIISNTKKADDKQQAIESWCDIIKKNEDLPRIFGRSESEEHPDIDFVLNKRAAELIATGTKVPDDMVLLFQGMEGWNQIGGIEKLADSYKYNVLPVLMGNMETKHIPLKKIDNLRWNLSDAAKTMANTSKTPAYRLDGIIIVALLFIIIKQRKYVIRYSVLSIIVAAAAIFGGYYFSQFGAEILYIGEPSKLTDYTTVYIINAAIGIAFVLLLAPWVKNQIDNRVLFFKATFLAGLCGLAASTLTHIYIMIYKDTSNLWGIIGGAGYGIYAGMVLGVITYWMIRLWRKLFRKPTVCRINHPGLPATPPFKGGEL